MEKQHIPNLIRAFKRLLSKEVTNVTFEVVKRDKYSSPRLLVYSNLLLVYTIDFYYSSVKINDGKTEKYYNYYSVKRLTARQLWNAYLAGSDEYCPPPTYGNYFRSSISMHLEIYEVGLLVGRLLGFKYGKFDRVKLRFYKRYHKSESFRNSYSPLNNYFCFMIQTPIGR